MGAVRGSTKARRDATDVQVLAERASAEQPSKDPRLAGLVERLTGEIVLRHASGQRCLDLGCGRPTVGDWVARACGSLERVERSALDSPEVTLPFGDGAFDLVYALRTLPHLGTDETSSDAMVASLLHEVARVMTRDGAALLEVYNPLSLWGMSVGLRRPAKLLDGRSLVVQGEDGVTRFDSTRALGRLLPPSLRIAGVHGGRVVTIGPHVLEVPVLGRMLERLEWRLRDTSPTRSLGAHLLVELRRKKPPSRKSRTPERE